MDTEVVEPAAPSNAPLGESGFEQVPGPPEVTIDEVDLLLDEVEAALTRLDEGTYGTCRGCGTPIDDTRLADRPTAQTCGACDTGGTGDTGDTGDTGEFPVAPDAGADSTGSADWADNIVEDGGPVDPGPAPALSPWSIRGTPEG